MQSSVCIYWGILWDLQQQLEHEEWWHPTITHNHHPPLLSSLFSKSVARLIFTTKNKATRSEKWKAWNIKYKTQQNTLKQIHTTQHNITGGNQRRDAVRREWLWWQCTVSTEAATSFYVHVANFMTHNSYQKCTCYCSQPCYYFHVCFLEHRATLVYALLTLEQSFRW